MTPNSRQGGGVTVEAGGYTPVADPVSARPVRLAVRSLAKSYGSGENRTDVIRDLSFDVHEREFACIVGPSGIGKTTLLDCLSGLQTPTGGSVQLDGELVTEPPRKMAVVFQEYTRSLMPWLTVQRNVTLPLRGRGLSRGEVRERARLALAEVGLPDAGNNYPWQLSGGMQQRVAIARALAYEPEVMLMDEPFASVDAQTRFDLEDLVLKLRDALQITVVLVTHDIDEAVYLADRIIVLGERPCRSIADIDVPLATPRDQVESRELPEFMHLRSEVLTMVRRAGALPVADASSAGT